MEKNYKDTITINRIGNVEEPNEKIRIVIRRRGGEKAVLYEGMMELEEFARCITSLSECNIETTKVCSK